MSEEFLKQVCANVRCAHSRAWHDPWRWATSNIPVEALKKKEPGRCQHPGCLCVAFQD